MRYFSRNNISLLISLLMLSLVMGIWSDLFLFSKTFNFPSWAKNFPWPVYIPSYLVFICLIPAALLSNSLSGLGRAIGVSGCVAPLVPLMIYVFSPSNQNKHIMANFFINYLWIVFVHCLLPALILFLIRALVFYIPTKILKN
jgi:hypothetical protein